MGITQDKAALRRVLRGQTLPPHRRQQASAAICASLLALPELANAPVVFAFVPPPREPDLPPALPGFTSPEIAFTLRHFK